MKVTFPHLGNCYIAFKCLFESLGTQVITPPLTNRRTIELGTRYSPETACLPFKINLGNFLEAIELGADTLFMLGGVGACRFGYYGEVQKKILQDMGYNLEYIIMDPQVWYQLWRGLQKTSSRFSFLNFCSAFYLAWEKIKVLDSLEKFILSRRAYQEVKGEVDQVYQQGLQLIDQPGSSKELRNNYKSLEERIRKIKWKKDWHPLKIGIIGEIYMVMEPAANLNIERILGDMGVEVIRSFYLSNWVKNNLILKRMGDRKLKRIANPYLPHCVCGHGQENVAETILYAQKGFDGIIHLAPFGCMPEIVAKTILPQISKDMDIPLLCLSLDEHAGEAGLITRIEAFLELLERKREQNL